MQLCFISQHIKSDMVLNKIYLTFPKSKLGFPEGEQHLLWLETPEARGCAFASALEGPPRVENLIWTHPH
jgi:hypothetical protein